MDETLNLRNASKQISASPPYQKEGELSWQTEEFAFYEKELQWFLIAGIVAAGLFVSLLILKNIFGAATILLFAVIMYMYANKKPDVITVVADARGIRVNDKLTLYSALASFWVLYEPPVKDLILIHKARFVPKVIIPLGNADPLELREILLANSVAEKEEEESLADIIARRLGF
ncbi:hypothetical protein HYR65_02590 [Candidatus Azambacteria bacterium]|nr:hypothetical protein [Candidatus Azambacteria bacterium]